jgi:hypothetical protein
MGKQVDRLRFSDKSREAQPPDRMACPTELLASPLKHFMHAIMAATANIGIILVYNRCSSTRANGFPACPNF